jgi:hypothetical protein
MTNLVIDIGNTDIKAAVFEDDKLLHAGRYQNLDINLLNSVLEVHKVGTTIISTVRKGQEAWEPALKEKTRFIYFNAKMAAGINNLIVWLELLVQITYTPVKITWLLTAEPALNMILLMLMQIIQAAVYRRG